MDKLAKILGPLDGLFEVIGAWTEEIGVLGLIATLTVAAILIILTVKSPTLVTAFSQGRDRKKRTDVFVAGKNDSLKRQQFEFEKKHNLNQEGDNK